MSQRNTLRHGAPDEILDILEECPLTDADATRALLMHLVEWIKAQQEQIELLKQQVERLKPGGLFK